MPSPTNFLGIAVNTTRDDLGSAQRFQLNCSKLSRILAANGAPSPCNPIGRVTAGSHPVVSQNDFVSSWEINSKILARPFASSKCRRTSWGNKKGNDTMCIVPSSGLRIGISAQYSSGQIMFFRRVLVRSLHIFLGCRPLPPALAMSSDPVAPASWAECTTSWVCNALSLLVKKS